MNTKNNQVSGTISLLFWAALLGLLIQAAVIFILPQANVACGDDTENLYIGLHLFNLINS